jgi:hypothetical protein
LIGNGSEGLGFDTPMSTDHCWGPRLLLFLSKRIGPGSIRRCMTCWRKRLPPNFLGYRPISLRRTRTIRRAAFAGTATRRTLNHRVEIHTLRSFCMDLLGWDTDTPLAPADWLTFHNKSCRL